MAAMNNKKRLSKNLLQMKFMKRTKEKQERDIENDERHTLFKSQISEAMQKQGSRFVVEPSYVNVENLGFGRLSFHGMNPDIERMMENDRLRDEEIEQDKKEKDVNDADMAEHFGNLKGTIAKKFAPKRTYDGSKLDGPAVLEEGNNILGKIRQIRAESDASGGSKKKRFMKPKD